MAASYSTGISSSPTNLLQTLVTWLVAQGWTSDSSVSDGAGWRAHLHKGGLYVNLRAAENDELWPKATTGFHDTGGGGYGIGLYLGTGYSGASAWHLQAGRPLRPDTSTNGCGANLPAGSVSAYYFFDDGNDQITVVVERSPGIFCHFGWGPTMADIGLPEAFPFFYGSSSAYRNSFDGALGSDRHGINVSAFAPMSQGDLDIQSDAGSFPPPEHVHSTAFVKVDAASWAARWIANGNRPEDGYGYTGRYMRCALNDNPATLGLCNEGELPGYRFLRGRSHQAAFAGALILPLHCYLRTDPAGRWASVGYPPTVFWCEAVGHGYSAGDVYQVGGLNYKLFPGFAVRKAA